MTPLETHTLILYSSVNTPGKKDSTGAFHPGAVALRKRLEYKLSKSTLAGIDCSKPKANRRAQVVDAFTESGPVTDLAVFCHGFERGIQIGYDRENVATLAEMMIGAPVPRIVLYACDAAGGPGPGGDGGFADALRDALCSRGATHCQVDAHVTTGHAYANPHVRRFLGMGSPVGGTGGSWIVAPKTKLWPKWVARLRDANDPLWCDFPSLTTAQIHLELSRE